MKILFELSSRKAKTTTTKMKRKEINDNRNEFLTEFK